MHRSFRHALLGATMILAAACASQSAGAATTRHNLVTTEQLERAGDVNLYDALRTVRPAFLRTRQPAMASTPEVPIRVYVGGLQMMEGLEHLRQLRARSVQEVEFLEPHQANSRFGGSNQGGALLVVMKP